MDLTYYELKEVQSGSQAQKYNFWASFVNHTDSAEKTWNLAYFVLQTGKPNKTSYYQKEKSNKTSYIISWFVIEMYH